MNAAASRVVELYRARELIFLLVGRDLKVRYKRSILGMFWSLLSPLLQMIVYTFVFSTIMRVNLPAYPVFLLSGLLPWMLISSAAASAMALLANQGLITKVAAPQAVYPLAVVGSKLIDVSLSLIPLAIIGAAIGRPPGATWVTVVPAMLVTAAFTTGLALLFSSLTVFFRDLKHLVDILFQIWFYLTPIIYSSSHIDALPHAWMKWALHANPATSIVQWFQQAIYEGRFPDASTVSTATLSAAIVLAGGFAAFTTAEHRHIHHF
jgi:ABC-type polysaccharide/polyol phosphate export permease